MRTGVVFDCLVPLISSALAQEPEDRQIVAVGPWHITTTYKADRFANCTMTRSTAGLGIAFVRNSDGLLLLLDSAKWKLERVKVDSVRVVGGSESVEAKAVAESKSVTIALPERPFNERLRKASVLEVRGEGATLRVPLDKSTAALERLEVCFEKNGREGPETNPFVAPNRRP